MIPKKEIRKSAVTGKAVTGFTNEERAAMKERAQELKADGEGDVLAKIAGMPEPDRGMAERLHAIVKASHRQSQRASPFAENLVRFGFSDKANLDEGTVWPVAFALKELTAADEARIGALVKKAVS